MPKPDEYGYCSVFCKVCGWATTVLGLEAAFTTLTMHEANGHTEVNDGEV